MNQPSETISALRVDLYDCDERPSDILAREAPATATRKAWIPQTMGEQIWVLYDFASVADREAWEATLSPKVRGWLDRDLISSALSYGWFIRDENGFTV